MVGGKWLDDVRFIYPVGKAEPTCESIERSKQMRDTDSTNNRGRIPWAAVDNKGIPKDVRFQVNLKGFRVEFR